MENEFESPARRRTERDEYRSRFGTEEKTKSKSGKTGESGTDKLIRLLGIQLLLCAAGVLLILAISKLSPSAGERMKADYHRLTERNMSIGEIFSGIKGGAELVFNPSDGENASEPASEYIVSSFETENDETGETVAVGEIIGDGSGGGDIGEKEAIKGTSFSAYKISGAPVIPVPSPRVTSKFGYRTNPVSGKYGFHTGIDLAVREGTPISAVFFGTVEETGENDVWGKYVLLKHSDGLETYYCHMNEIYAEEGAVIRQGETIGTVGTTGWSTGPHLHFEVRIDGIRVDPERLLSELL